MLRRQGFYLASVALAGAASAVLAASAAQAAEAGADGIVVIASPLSSDDDSTANARTLQRSQALSVAEQLARTAPGVSITETQGNPLQPDITFRGYTASPLLGTPQGLSVYVDGIRANQPFGDVVSWDLIPASFINAIDLVRGASPQFGRNALGGAITIETKDGRSNPGLRLEASHGSFDRLAANGSIGGESAGGVNWFLAGDHFREDGWRDLSPSRVSRALARLGWADARSDIALIGMFADTDLNGNGLQEMRLLAADRSSIYTAPDNTRNRSWIVNLKGKHELADALTIQGNLFWRRLRTDTDNGDINDDSLGGNPYQPDASELQALSDAGYAGFPLAGETQANTPFPKWRCIANVLLNTEPNENCNGLANRSNTRQTEWGGGGEVVWRQPLGGIEQRLTLGLAYVRSKASFNQSTQFAYLLPDRTVMPVEGPGAFADGTQDSEDAFDARVDLRTQTSSLGLYLLEQAQLTPELRLDLGGRYDRTSVHNRDQITPGGGTGSLDSDPVYARFNPSAGLTWRARSGIELSASWAQASRAPSAIELGCSDPESPCRLPNALAGDPPLRQVVAQSWDARAGITRQNWALKAGVFRTDASDDILFVTNDPSGYGYFRNFGNTRRQGMELEGRASAGAFVLTASYTLLDAIYRSAEVVGGSANSSSDAVAPGFDGNIRIAPGNRIPLIPRHLFKAALAWGPRPALSFSLDMVAASGSFARGNENNAHEPDGIHYLGAGKSDGYAVFNLGGEVRPAPGLTVFAMIRNLFDRHYATAAQLGATAFDTSGNYVARPFAAPVVDGERPMLNTTFYAPGAPRSIQLGARLRF